MDWLNPLWVVIAICELDVACSVFGDDKKIIP